MATLKALRERARLTQQDLAERSGVSVATLRALEKGYGTRGRPRTVQRVARALGLDPAAIDEFRLEQVPLTTDSLSNGGNPELGDDRAQAAARRDWEFAKNYCEQ